MIVVPAAGWPARVMAALALLLVAVWISAAQGSERRCRGGKQFYGGQCRYPEEIRSLQQQAARDRAAAARREQEQAARQAEESAQRDEQACERARAADTVEGWQQYSADHPDGACEAEAMGRITLLRREASEPAAAEPQPDVRDEEASGPLSPLVYVGFGIGAAGFVTWGIAGGLSLAKRSTLSDECPGDVCTPEQQDTIDSGEAAGHVATVGMIVGFAGATLGVIGLLLPRGDDETAEATVRPRIGPGTIGLSGRF